jgi:hypothetical protein
MLSRPGGKAVRPKTVVAAKACRLTQTVTRTGIHPKRLHVTYMYVEKNGVYNCVPAHVALPGWNCWIDSLYRVQGTRDLVPAKYQQCQPLHHHE